MRHYITAALAFASLSAQAGGSIGEAKNLPLVLLGKQGVVALSCSVLAGYLVPQKGKETPYYVDASYAKEAARLRAYGLKTARSFIERRMELTKEDAFSHVPSYYHSLDYSQGTDFALGQLTNSVRENVTDQFKGKDTMEKRAFDVEIWQIYARSGFDDGNCELIGR